MLRVLVGEPAGEPGRQAGREGGLVGHRQAGRQRAREAGLDAEAVPVAERRHLGVRTGLLEELSLRGHLGRLARLDPPGDGLPEAAARLGAAEQEHPPVGPERHHRDGAEVGRAILPLSREERREMAGELLLDLGHGRGGAPARGELLGEARHSQARVGDAAGDDDLEVPQVGRDVEGEPVRGDPARQVHADGADLLVAHPGAAVLLVAAGLDGVIGAGADHRLLQRGHVLPDVRAVGEIEHRIRHELPRPVVGHVAPAIGGVDLEALLPEPLRRGDDVPALGAPAEGEHGRVLQQEQVVGGRGQPLGHRRAGERHQAQAVLVLDAAELVDLQRPHACAAAPLAFSRRGRSGRLSAWMASPSAALHASMNASGRVGCACTVSATSSR